MHSDICLFYKTTSHQFLNDMKFSIIFMSLLKAKQISVAPQSFLFSLAITISGRGLELLKTFFSIFSLHEEKRAARHLTHYLIYKHNFFFVFTLIFFLWLAVYDSRNNFHSIIVCLCSFPLL